ncbi:MacS family sensor histidine kinase, partial [Kitasatospora sp. MBT63]|uniref:MacS family sensor histidine kinase n=1 Tax=Kitasatospora sp. MBT63 TaxID=1444768 RepID=UPI0026F46E05
MAELDSSGPVPVRQDAPDTRAAVGPSDPVDLPGPAGPVGLSGPVGVARALAAPLRGSLGAGGMSVELPLWRAISYFRVMALAYAVVRFFNAYLDVRHPVAGWIYLGALTLWTLATSRAFANPLRCTWAVLGTDLAVVVTGVLLSGYVDTPERIRAGALTLPTIWACGTVLGAACKGGWRPAALFATMIGLANIGGHGGVTPDNLHNIVLLLMAGCAVGYVIELARASEAVLTRALQVEAATRERERLARDIHDGVLQVLALVQRQGDRADPADPAGPGGLGELGRLAGEQERALRALMSGAPLPAAGTAAAELDLRQLLAPYADERITVSAPGTAVLLPGPVAGELAAAVGAAVDNVRKHAGPAARAWILVEDEPDAVTVSVRDDGPGLLAGRPARA